MGLEHPNLVDAAGIDRESGDVVLTIADAWDRSGVEAGTGRVALTVVDEMDWADDDRLWRCSRN